MNAGGKREGGATIVEMAIVFPLILLSVIALVEVGLVFKDFLSTRNAVRTGGNIASIAGNDVNADFAILEEIKANLLAADFGDVQWIKISNPDGAGTTTYNHTPGPPCDWTPCPEFGNPAYVAPGYNPATRDISAPTTGRVRVEVDFVHNSITGLFGTSQNWTSESTVRIEPQVFN